jgi:predicted RNA-binding protein (virulence factor B family)
MIYKNQIFREVALGDKVEAYVSRITDDNRIDLSLQQKGFAQVKDSAEVLYDAIVAAGGSLALTDNSAPEVIHAQLKMSKKVFKRSLGMLMSHGRVVCTDDAINIKE